MKQLNIMWVEDQNIWAKYYRAALEKKKHKVTWIGTANEALDALEAGGFDVMILDIWLISGDSGNEARKLLEDASQFDMGIELLRFARDNKIAIPPTVALSGVFTQEKIDALKEFIQPQRIMSKPPDVNDLVKAVEEAAGVTET